MLPRVAELISTSWSLAAFAEEFLGGTGPFAWDEQRRWLLMAELNACCFVLAEIERREAARVLESFRIVRQREVAEHGTYRTKELILDVYDRMTSAIGDRRALPDDPRPTAS